MLRRALHIGWVINYLEDLEADFRVFYRVDDFDEIDGPKFFRLAMRVGAYQGAIAARMAEEREEEEEVAPRQGPPRRQQNTDDRTVRATVGELGMAAPGWFAFTKVKKTKD